MPYSTLAQADPAHTAPAIGIVEHVTIELARPRPDPVLAREMPFIQQIISDETWLEGERRGCRVSPQDAVVMENVCRVVLRIGQQLRESLEHEAVPGAVV